MSNSLDSDQARRYVGPDLSPICLQRLSADDKRKERFKQGSHGQGKVSEKRKKFKVREKSGNFELSQGNLKFWEKSGKSQGIL